jgi:very-short-patch-repair endonuclease
VLNEILRRQDGVITLEQARQTGLSQQAVQRRLNSGTWLRCARGVYFVNDRELSDAARIRAAVRDGTRLRRRDLDTSDLTALRDLRVTARPLTVVEAAVRRPGGAQLMDRALQRDVELRQLWRAHLRNKGRYGSPAARRLLQAADDGARSAAERLLVKLLRGAGITGWRANYPLGGYKIDVAFPNAGVAIETDGWAFHSDALSFQVDRKRQNAIALLGWQVLRFTWLDLTEYPQRVIATIRRAISAR